MPLTYREVGVDIDRQEAAIRALVSNLKFKRRGFGASAGPEGGYAGLVSLGQRYLALSTDGVGTKLMVAKALDSWENVGVDCVAINVNDILCVGAEPLALVDYIATERYDEGVAAAIGRGLDRGAHEANISVVGGEFACVPDLVKQLDLLGTALGFVDKRRLVTGAFIEVGDALVGIPSSGLHSNGFTLVRAILAKAGVNLRERLPGLPRPVGEELLTPTRIYVKEVLATLEARNVHGLAHISGGGLWNLLRLKRDVAFVVDDPLPPQPIFQILHDLGRLEAREMYQTFNMGMGFLLVLPPGEAEEVRKDTPGSRIVGRVEGGRGVKVQPLDLQYGP